ncbi:nuclear pore complex subunit [Entomophthora muscae]|uniref:Nuclear pore complex subunit n=1 Tax=Entomophthora muscae TaxID=34485 RepID=A0ACC2S0V6_9FUNG|nr:nuclear pore complex subunit [Entomophthora muscae]
MNETGNSRKFFKHFASSQEDGAAAESSKQHPIFSKPSTLKRPLPLSPEARARLESEEGQNLIRLGFSLHNMLSHCSNSKAVSEPAEPAEPKETYYNEVVKFDLARPISALEPRLKRKILPEEEPFRQSKRTSMYNKLLSPSGPFYPFNESDVLKELARSLGFVNSDFELHRSHLPNLCTLVGASTPACFVAFSPLVQKIINSPDTIDVVGEFAQTSDGFIWQEETNTGAIWRVVKHMVNSLHALNIEGEATSSVPQGYFRDMYSAQGSAYFSPEARKFRVSIKASALSFLGNMYRDYIDSVVETPHESIYDKISEFITSVHAYPEYNFWAHVYYLLRCDYREELKYYLTKNEKCVRKSDMFLFERIQEMLTNPDESVTEDEQQAVLKAIRHLDRVSLGSPNVFHMALLKLVGCIDPKTESVSGVCESFEDTLWFQLYSTREPAANTEEVYETSSSTLDISDEAYDAAKDLESAITEPIFAVPSDSTIWSLESLQKLIMAGGPSDSFLSALLLTGQFEQAVNYVSKIDISTALHLAIVLQYYGLLKTANKPKFSLMGEVYSFSVKGSHIIGEIQLDSLLVSTLSQMGPSDASIVLPYILSLGRLPYEVFKKISHNILERVVVDTKQYDTLLGVIKPNEQVEIGLLRKYKDLLQADDFDGFFRKVCRRAALNELMSNNLKGAESLFSLLEDYKSCIQIITKQLSDVLFPISLSLNCEIKPELVRSSELHINRMKDRLLRHLRLSSSPEDCPVHIAASVILEMVDFCLAYLKDNDAEGRILIYSLYIIPKQAHLDSLTEKYKELTSLNTWVKRCIPPVYSSALQFIKRSVGFPLFISNEPEDLELVKRAQLISLLIEKDSSHSLIPVPALSSIRSETFFVQYGLAGFPRPTPQ